MALDNHGPLPVELYLHLLPLLDSVTYIAFAQSCRLFRSITVTESYHFVQRLLILELDPLYGGPVPVFNVSGNVQLPRFVDSAWERLRYACAGCLRLRHFSQFAPRYTFKLPFRKPRPWEPAAEQLAEPGDARERWRGRQSSSDPDIQIDPMDQWRSHILRRRYICQKLFPEQSYFSWLVDRTGLRAEDECQVQKNLVGWQRYRRLCVDCSGDKSRRHGRLDNSARRVLSLADDWDTLEIQGRPEFRITYPGRSTGFVLSAPAYLVFQCSRCKGWEDDPEALVRFKELSVLLYKWDFSMPAPWWRSTKQWVCDECTERGVGSNEAIVAAS